MSQKTKPQLEKELKELNSEKEQLLQAKTANAKAFTKEQQKRLDDVAEAIIDFEEQIALAPEETPAKSSATNSKYVVPKGTEKMVHIKVVSGNRYNPKTGKEVNAPVARMFTYGEWQLFKKNFK
jgi:septal ring factor EnvC (AmiA/AmiB activator)